MDESSVYLSVPHTVLAAPPGRHSKVNRSPTCALYFCAVSVHGILVPRGSRAELPFCTLKLASQASFQSAVVMPLRALPTYPEDGPLLTTVTCPPEAREMLPAWTAAVQTDESLVYTSVPYTVPGEP